MRKYANGYTGFIEEADRYVYFFLSRSGVFKRLLAYDKKDFTDYGHFLGGISRFFPFSSFLKEPVTIPRCTIKELDSISEHMGKK